MSITFMGNPLTLEGNKLNVGDIAPDFNVIDNELNPKSLSDYEDKIKVISSVPSLDTDVCDQQTRKFNQELSNLDNIIVLTISNDLPFAQARWCGASGLDSVITLSDHFNLDFSIKYGLHIKELRLLSRAVFVLDSNNEIKYVEYLDEITNHPNYDAAIQAVKSL